MKHVLVAGATGYLGGHIVTELQRRGAKVRALSRDRERAAALGLEPDGVFVGKVTDAASLQGVCEDIDMVISSIGITKQKDRLTFMDVDYQGNLNLLREAQRSGVKKFVYVSVFGAQDLQHLKVVEAKLRFERELRDSGLSFTVVYPNGFFSDMADYLEMARKGHIFLLGHGEYRINPIHGADLAALCVDALDRDVEELPVGGPDVMTHNDIACLACDAIGKPHKLLHVPEIIGRIFLQMLRAGTPVRIYGPLEFFLTVMTRDMIAPLAGSRHLWGYFNERPAGGGRLSAAAEELEEYDEKNEDFMCKKKNVKKTMKRP